MLPEQWTVERSISRTDSEFLYVWKTLQFFEELVREESNAGFAEPREDPTVADGSARGRQSKSRPAFASVNTCRLVGAIRNGGPFVSITLCGRTQRAELRNDDDTLMWFFFFE
jgi:hypothetical protein